MAQKTNSIERFWKELKRRKVIHVITVYAAVSFVVLQLVDMVARPLQLPDWTEAFMIVLLTIGFVIAVFVSWIYDITPAGVKKTKPIGAAKHTDHIATPASNGWKIATYIAGIIILALVAFNLINKRRLNADISKLAKSIAVLPFINDSPDTTNAYFINGIMERITTNLQMVKEFRVISRTSVEQYRNNKTKSILEIAKELDVNYIIEGSGQRYGNSFSVTTQLIKAKGKETHLWAKTYDQEIKEVNDYIRIQSQVAQAVATELKAIITPKEKQLIEKIPTTSLTAQDFYQRGRDELTKYWSDNMNKTALQKAEDLFYKALKYDSTFAQAYSSLALVYWNKHSSANEYFSENYGDSALILCNIALSFDNKLAEAYILRGYYYTNRGIINKAIDDFDKSLEINPNSWEAYSGKGYIYYNDDFVNWIDNLHKAASLNHGSQLPDLLRGLSWAYLQTGFKDKAKYYNLEAFKLDGDSVSYLSFLSGYEVDSKKGIELLLKAYAIDSTNSSISYQLGIGYMFLNQSKESLKYYKRYFEILKSIGSFTSIDLGRMGWAYWENGYKKEAEYYFDKQLEYCINDIKLKRPWGQTFIPYYDVASIYAFRGDKEKAYENLKIFDQKQSMPLWAPEFIKTDPFFNSIRNEPEFQKIARDIEAKYQAEHERLRKWLEEQGML